TASRAYPVSDFHTEKPVLANRPWKAGLSGIRGWGRPLGRVSTGKKVFVPKILNSLGPSHCCRVSVLPNGIRACHFVDSIPDRNPPHLAVGRSVQSPIWF